VVTPGQPGSLTASRITTWPGGIVAEIVIDEQACAFGRWSEGGSWSAWWPVADGVRDVSLVAAEGDQEPAALVSIVRWTPMPVSPIAARHHKPYKQAFYRLSASGIAPADL
jgi:hypothetical protein